MEEQTTQQSTPSTWDAAADGAAYQGYDEPETDTNEETFSQSEPEPEYDEYDEPSADLKPNEIALDDTGNIQFGDDFFGDMPDDIEPEDDYGSPDTPNTPNYYTDDELKNTPFEQWDTERLNGDIQKFAPIVREQMQRRNAQARAQSIQNAPMPSDITEPKQYTPKELSDEAMKLACEKLGLEGTEDFDDYEPEHRAAMALATQELIQRRNSDITAYQRGQSEWGQLQRFNAELAQRPDYNEFNNWYIGKLHEVGVTAEQVNNGLYYYAKQNGNRFSVIPQIISSWYREFVNERNSASVDKQPSGRQQTNTRPRTDRPPVLESTRGNDYGGRRTVNLHDFGYMDADEQAQALMRMGLV